MMCKYLKLTNPNKRQCKLGEAQKVASLGSPFYLSTAKVIYSFYILSCYFTPPHI